ncbi:hypothetical protein IMZ48_13035 [Candidatus Bathyarchaeota archaeon]|nr:hypothetical protein [Candidatus Bathyarchaeota archaeon]
MYSKTRAGHKDTGLALAELDDATKAKAEAKYWSYWDLHGDVSPEAQGPASFD